MFFWAFSEVTVIYVLLRMLFGRDVVIITSGTFSVRKELFGFGRTKTYIVSEMHDVRFQPEIGSGKSAALPLITVRRLWLLRKR